MSRSMHNTRITRFFARRMLLRVGGLLGLVLVGCIGGVPNANSLVNPFIDLPPIVMNGRFQPITTDIVPLGEFAAGDVFEVHVESERVEAVLILTEDERFEEAGSMVSGGPANTPFNVRVQIPGRYFAYIQFEASTPDTERTGRIALSTGDPDYAPPAEQIVVIEFADGYLSEPGLFDPDSMTPDDQAFFASIEETVADQVIAGLQTLFAETPIVILDGRIDSAAPPYSAVRLLPDRILADEQFVPDTALPPPDPNRPECGQRVIFGEILPEGVFQDVGNRRHDDEAFVYVGSFQGRSATCQTAVINSVNNVVLSLTNTAAHEIGHLIGLYHTEQITVMNRSATLAFFRALPFERSQIQVDKPFGDDIRPEVITTVIQDPDVYFQTSFGP